MGLECSRLLLPALLLTAICAGQPAYIRCLDSSGEPLEEAAVILARGERVEFSGMTNSSGWAVAGVSGGVYQVEVVWLNRTVYSGELRVEGLTRAVLNCSVHRLTIRVNLLGLIPVTQARVRVEDEEGRLVYSHCCRLRVPYRLYSLSAEIEVRLPAGKYLVTVEMIGSETLSVELSRDAELVFTRVASPGAIMLLALAATAAISLALFRLLEREAASTSRSVDHG